MDDISSTEMAGMVDDRLNTEAAGRADDRLNTEAAGRVDDRFDMKVAGRVDNRLNVEAVRKVDDGLNMEVPGRVDDGLNTEVGGRVGDRLDAGAARDESRKRVDDSGSGSGMAPCRFIVSRVPTMSLSLLLSLQYNSCGGSNHAWCCALQLPDLGLHFRALHIGGQ